MNSSKIYQGALQATRARGVVTTQRAMNSRLLTTSTTNTVNKLRCAIEEYRMKNFTQDLPSRCKKEIIQAAVIPSNIPNQPQVVTFESFMTVVDNIGASALVTKQDVEGIFTELAEDSSSRAITKEKIMNLL